MKPRDLVFGLFAPFTFEHTYPVRSDVYSHLPFTLTVKKKKKEQVEQEEQEEENRKKKQSNKPKQKEKEGKNNRVHYGHDTNFCSGTSARSQCVYSL